MLSYFAILALGIIGVNRLREGLLILQRRHDAKLLQEATDRSIITNDVEQCKQFMRAG